MSADDELLTHVPDGELHGATIATVDTDGRTCTVLLPLIDGGSERTPPIPYDPHVVEGDDGLELRHPRRGDPALVPEDNRGRFWVAKWTHA